MAFIQDPRLRQRWNQLSHTTETVTSDAAAGIWTLSHDYVAPCLSSLAAALDTCVDAACLGCCGADREERARRRRERDRGARRVEYSFDFYDDWEEEFPGGVIAGAEGDDLDGGMGEGETGGRRGGGRGGLFGGWGPRGEDWDRLLAGTGGRKGGGMSRGGVGGVGEEEVVDQPRRKRGMSYGTGTTSRGGVRRKVSGGEEDPNVIPRTAPLGFLGRLPFKIVGSLRYKPSAANLREHPGGGAGMMQGHYGDGEGGERRRGEDHEHEPLLGMSGELPQRRSPPRQHNRARSDTTTSGETSSSYRSRGDLFPSDGEGEEDAVPLDDEFTVELERVDDRSSNKTRSSKGKRPADRDRDKGLSRTVSRTTMSSVNAPGEAEEAPTSPLPRELRDEGRVPSLEDLRREEEEAEREEYEEIERRRRAAAQLALKRGLSTDEIAGGVETAGELKDDAAGQKSHQFAAEEPAMRDIETLSGDEIDEVEETKPLPETPPEPALSRPENTNGKARGEGNFVPARLPHFG